ncbi:TRAP transporter small permease [Mesorhizobium sp. LHD-90]|uniref:TRAP transporter small permease n=1 Tax=Mesorhizobium sp. LHD-90 TaxID=3071414 RepID=UPI0027E15129|nr:TRAP transporter small permease [Mesorhizobium sp. LHD-90]MDQ6436974.1 TRAP transporter small permease [Mesorhizobium sp. LHD-90]
MTAAHHPVDVKELAKAFESEEVADLSTYGSEDWLTLALFWVMVACVFLQFFSRYVLNSSYAWTEEVAINLLVAVVFLGSSMCVRLSRHIQVDLLYHYLPQRVGRCLAVAVDILRLAFFGYAAWLMWRYIALVSDERMLTVDLSKAWFLYLVLLAFALMFVRSVQVAIRNWRRGYSVLERPEAFLTQGN